MRECIERPDQNRQWKQLVDVARNSERDVGKGVLQSVSALAEIGQLPDQVEKREQGEERGEYEQGRPVDLPREIGP